MVKTQGVVIPYTAVVTAKTGVKKWSRGQEVKDKSGQDAIEEGEATGSIKQSRAFLQCGQVAKKTVKIS